MDISTTTITTRLEKALHGLQDEFRGIYDTNDFTNAARAVAKAEGKGDYASKLRVLLDMFDVCGIPYKKGEKAKYYVDLVNNSMLPSFPEIEDRMMYALYCRYEKYPSPEKYMKRIVDRLCNPEDGWENDTLRVRILKQFIKYGNGLAPKESNGISKAGFGGVPYVKDYARDKGCKKTKDIDSLFEYIDDGIFDVLPDADREQRRPRGKYGLLKAVDDIALGKFRTEGATKVFLYLFAMVYGMTYYSGFDNGSYFDKKKDIDINLFRDYYTNNFIRYITDAYRGRLNEFDLDPTGQGINYKNYAEMVYLYYISRDMEGYQKMIKSAEMIGRIRAKMDGKGYEAGSDKPSYSKDFRSFFLQDDSYVVHSEDILSLDEEMFEAFLCMNYNCDCTKCNNTPILLETSHNTAFETYNEILELIVESGKPLNTCNYGLWFSDVAGFFTRNSKRLVDEGKADPEKYNEFMDLLKGINNYLGVTSKEGPVQDPTDFEGETKTVSREMTKALDLKKPEAVTRSAIIAAYYYYFNNIHEDDDLDGSLSFEELFEEFKDGVDPYLDRAHYHLFSGRDLFDVMTAFSSYAYIYL